MSNKKRSVLLRAPGLVVLLALLLATAGLVYAHWTATLNVDGQIQTGNVYVEWVGAWTNDDGQANDDGERTTSEVYDFWGDQSSADPSAPGIDPSGESRYNKDVGRCQADAGGDHLNFNVENAYPSYHCTLSALLGNQGSVPVRATALTFSATRDDVSIPINPGQVEGTFVFGNVPQVEGDVSLGVRCGTQIDPMNCRYWFQSPLGKTFWEGPWGEDQDGFFADVDGNNYVCDGDQCWPDGEYKPNGVRNDGDFALTQECDLDPVPTNGWIHVMEDAFQNANYQFQMHQEFVNWNEWDVGMCSIGAVVDMDGDPSTPPDGYIDGNGDYVAFPVP